MLANEEPEGTLPISQTVKRSFGSVKKRKKR